MEVVAGPPEIKFNNRLKQFFLLKGLSRDETMAASCTEIHPMLRENVSMLAKTYGCGQCSGKCEPNVNQSAFKSQSKPLTTQSVLINVT